MELLLRMVWRMMLLIPRLLWRLIVLGKELSRVIKLRILQQRTTESDGAAAEDGVEDDAAHTEAAVEAHRIGERIEQGHQTADKRDGGRWSKRRRATEKVAERDGTSGLELMEQVTESVTGDRKGNCCSSMAQWRLIGSQTGGIKVAVEESNMTTYLLMRLLLNIDGLKTAGKARV
ncbi:hypothetical protein Bca52824_048202 [Brassica carinata]|uniref:Uncharacterized protein n=1 Tax=Brassica carinata TaxID=52824 RepID=A0A8X7RIJ3_BRACI|nr:hypothetical protein Bca52824_048202 [Brassica carinata]